MAARPILEGITVLRLGQYGRPSLATAGLLVAVSCTLCNSVTSHLNYDMRLTDCTCASHGAGSGWPGTANRIGRPKTISYGDSINFECGVARNIISINGIASSIM